MNDTIYRIGRLTHAKAFIEEGVGSDYFPTVEGDMGDAISEAINQYDITLEPGMTPDEDAATIQAALPPGTPLHDTMRDIAEILNDLNTLPTRDDILRAKSRHTDAQEYIRCVAAAVQQLHASTHPGTPEHQAIQAACPADNTGIDRHALAALKPHTKEATQAHQELTNLLQDLKAWRWLVTNALTTIAEDTENLQHAKDLPIDFRYSNMESVFQDGLQYSQQMGKLDSYYWYRTRHKNNAS